MRKAVQLASGLLLAWLACQAAALALPMEDPPSAPPLGAEVGDDHAMPERADPVASYTLRATLDPTAHDIHGEGTIVFKNASSAKLSELYLHLYLNAFKNERTVFLRQPTGGFRGAGVPTDFGHITVTRFSVREMEGEDLSAKADRHSPDDPEDETDIRVSSLPRAIEPGETIHIDIAWDAHLPSLLFRTGYDKSFHMVAQWFPKLARLESDGTWVHFPFYRLSEFYADYGDYDVTIRTPPSYVVGATGKLVSERRSESGAELERRYVQTSVHDFAFTAWDRFREIQATSDEGVSIRCLYPPGYERAAEVELDTVRYGLSYFGKAYGRYPYETLTVVHPPESAIEAGGMEYPTLITTGGSFILPYTGLRPLEIVTIHELGHQWFYGLVGTNEHRWPFLDEGLNSYAEADALEARYPHASIGHLFGMSLALPAASRISANNHARNVPVATAASAFPSGGDYGSLVYSRTAIILGTLSAVYGEDKVRGIVGRYTRQYRFQHPGPEALIDAFRASLGDEVADTLRAALFDKATVDYMIDGIEFQDKDAPKGGKVLVRRLGELRFPVDVEMHAADGTVTRVPWDAKESAAWLPYTGESKLVAAVIDPDHRVLLDGDLTNNARKRGRSTLAPHVLERALFGAELGLSVLLP